MTDGLDNVVSGWGRGAAIRPVPAYAVVSEASLRRVEETMASEGTPGSSSMEGAFERFEETQRELSLRVQEVLEKPLDETALALGYFLTIAVWLAFEGTFEERLHEVSRDAWQATVDALELEENLRKSSPAAWAGLDDVLAREQPDIVAFVNDHIDAALESGGVPIDRENEGTLEGRKVDEEDVRLVYRTILLETLALSHAVAPQENDASPELLA